MAIVLITGASRGLGLEAVRSALRHGHRVRALARSAGQIQIGDERLERVPGNALDKDTVERALAGVDAVITTLGTPPTMRPVSLFSRAAAIMCEAMRTQGVVRLIAVTGIGAGDSRGIGGPLYVYLFQPLLLRSIYDDKDREERIVRNSGLDWTIVRPGFLTRLAMTGKYRVLTDPLQWEGGFISRRDVADFLVKQIDDRAMLRETPLLIG